MAFDAIGKVQGEICPMWAYGEEMLDKDKLK